MASYKNVQIIRWAVIITSFIIVALILWNTYDFFQKFKNEERAKMEILAGAYERFDTFDLNADFSLEDKIIGKNNNIPMIITEQDSITLWANLDSVKTKKMDYLKKQLAIMKGQNAPLIVSHKRGNTSQFIYYRDSDLLTKLKYYPVALILILFLFASVIYLFFKSNKVADQNKLWTGMARETAHQIGTPLSSLLGWIEILRLENTDENTVQEIENDVNRLNIIAERFSKIGSIPVLKKHNIVKATKDSFNYLELRSSKQVEFKFKTSNLEIFSSINIQLFSWVIENLIKNAIDAMEGKGKINLSISEDDKHVFIRIMDTGKGISRNLQQKIFSPGFTTKKRGWGLGLSLAKRIIEDYHNGKISVLKSELKKGTTFLIVLKK
ncbi:MULTISPECIES: sensor histidine kinase [Flavobacteriaceae]|uniref:histidine kinase n=2 Tax=Flavobacteriaceae TaxID=49546 RepID=A0A4Y8AQK5_9FLAO|nr:MULTISPECIES: HAMP domain-containing sensor histidine kinase [Flavobacteriaceae]TEW72434.1 HAMP domain-containing histidine kinase [Gramella jeungdoensis]GGK55882.1 two-component sensor histidine kinase [Lutibacter litoralis]